MDRRYVSLTVAFVLAASSAAAFAEDLAGNYAGPKLSLEMTSAGSGYRGVIHLGNQNFPFVAQGTAGNLQGTFNSAGNQFPFTAVLAGDEMTLTSGASTYKLQRQRPAAPNPLDAGPANPLSAPAANSAVTPASSAFTELAANRSGKTLFIQMPQATSAKAALDAALPELAKQLGGVRPHITGAFADQKEPTRGLASFTAKVDGQDVAGSILVGRGADGGEAVTITYARTDAPAADRAALAAALPASTRMQTHQFPDGTGSIDLPEGWTTQNQSVIGGVQVKGPADQTVTLGLGLSIVTPTSTAVRMQQQLEMQARQWGGPPPQPLRLLVAPFTGPVEALQNLIPQISQFSVRAGFPPVTLVKILQTSDTPANLPNGRAALLSYLVDKGEGASAVRYKAMAQIETYPLGGDGQESWGAFSSELAAPESHFDTDIATMWAIAQSFKTNDAVVAQKTQQIIQQNNQRFAAFQQSMKEKNAAFDSYMESVRNRERVNSRTNADFDEVIRGYRTVEDTRTGEHTSVDLGNAHDVVEKLNEADPGRYKEIPLRDEMYPLPDGK